MSILVVIGAAIFVFLGIAHAIFTLQSTPAGGPMTPTDPTTQVALERSGGLGLAPHLDIPFFQPWTGFNLSHSLGAAVSGLMIGLPALTDFDAALDETWWIVLALAVPPIYLLLSIRYWFEKPTQAIAVGTLLTTVGIVGGLVG